MDPSDAELTPDEVRRLAILEFEAMNPHLAGADIDAVLSSSEMANWCRSYLHTNLATT